MRYWLDTEFIEAPCSIDLISIGIVREDGAQFYAENADVEWTKASQWVLDNVRPHLHGHGVSRDGIALGVRTFVGDDKPEFWGYYADYDWVVFCWLFGAMIDLPKGWPKYCRDIKQWADRLGGPRLPKQASVEHNALADARWNREAWLFLQDYERDVARAAGGIGLIAAERRRQVIAEGWTPTHDDDHTGGELALASACYATPKRAQFDWPFEPASWKPSPDDRIRELAKAGALAAAEIDRLQRRAEPESPSATFHVR